MKSPPSALAAGTFAIASLLLAASSVLESRADTLPSASITEFLALNNDGLRDDDGDRGDWIEIWNTSGVGGDLDGWHLTDDPEVPTKWTFPAVQMTSGGYLVVHASSKDRTDAGGALHTNFKLSSAAGGYLALVRPDGVTVEKEFNSYPEQLADISYGTGFLDATQVTFLSAGDAARWHVPGGAVPGWQGVGFDDASWNPGATGIGYDRGTGYEGLFGAGGDVESEMSGINATIYIRCPFEVPDPAGIGNLLMRLKWEDGFIAYLNGTEFARGSAPTNPTWNSRSTDGSRRESDAETYFDYPVEAGSLVAGTNILAIHGLNTSTTSSDVVFVPELEGVQQNLGNTVAGFFTDPTPEAENGQRYDGIVRDTKFSVDRGFYDAPFDVTITTETPDASIRYTTDGSFPSATHGTLYNGPITISTTTVLRAIGYKDGHYPTNTDTHSYLFLDDVIDQPSNPPGFPSSWRGVSADYEMDPDITGPNANVMRDALLSLPSVCFSTDNDNLFGNSGIYANSNTHGLEEPCSFEWINPDGTTELQIDCGLRIQGGYFRQEGVTQKHSFRVLFKKEYGEGKLRHDLFGEPGSATEFDTFVFRAGANDGYAWGAARDTEQFLRDEFGRRLMLDIGHASPRGRFVHLYLNGLYWGLFNLCERPNEDFSSTYMGGEPEDWDSVNSGDVKSGSLSAWNAMLAQVRSVSTLADYQEVQGFNPNGSRNPAFPVYLDKTNYIDYMICNLYGGNWDWPNKNFWFGRKNGADSTGFKFYVWDYENTMGNNRGRSPLNMVAPRNTQWVGEPYGALRTFSEFKIDYGDRVHKHFFNGGELTPEKLIPKYQALADDIEMAMFAETARWGDDNLNPPQTIDDWRRERDWILNTYLPQRTAIVLGQFRNNGLYPAIGAPVFSQHGGSVSTATPVTMRTDADKLYFTTDGTDPRLPGGAISPTAQSAGFGGGGQEPEDYILSGDDWKYLDDGSDQGSAWRQPGYDDSAWASGPSELGYGDSADTVVGFVDVDPVAAGNQRNATTYFRKTITIPAPANFTEFLLTLQYDDGAAVYVNGAEVVRTGNLAANAAFDVYANSASPSENTFFPFTISSGAFTAGDNVIAVEMHNVSATSSDMSFNLTLRGEVHNSGGDNISQPLSFSAPTLLNARSFDSASGGWSALNSAFFTIDTVPADATNLVVSEFHYHPAEAPDGSVSADRDDYEFVELMNIGDRTIDLTGVRFSDGITFNFADHTLLAAGARMLLVKDLAPFTERYPDLPNPNIAGEYVGRLSNDGERILIASDGAGTIREFIYNDQLPWATTPDGGGPSMVLVDPSSSPDHNDPASWRPSAATHGQPGSETATATGYASWKSDNNITDDLGDDDNDGIDNLAEYALGTNPHVADASAHPAASSVAVDDQEFLAITFQKNLQAFDITTDVEVATDLANWSRAPGTTTVVSETPNPDGQTATVTVRSTTPIGTGPRQQMRLKIELQ